MRNSTRPSSLWQLAYNTLFPRRASSRHEDQQPATPEIGDSEITIGLDLYHQAIGDEDIEKFAALQLQTTQSTEMSFASANTEPEPFPQPTVPYAIGSGEWAFLASSTDSKEGDARGLSVDNIKSVQAVFTRVYAIAKIVCGIFLVYGADFDYPERNLPFHIKLAEEIVTSNSANVLIGVVENLYYALYTKLIIEIANVDLCSRFERGSCPAINLRFTLPIPQQVYKILMGFKDALDSPVVCSALNKRILRGHQQEFLQYASVRYAGMESENDMYGYRRFTMGVVTDSASRFREKWTALSEMYKMPPGGVLTVLSQRYLSHLPKITAPYDIPGSELPFIDLESLAEDEWEKRRRAAHHDSTMAILVSSCIGAVRRDEAKRTLIDFVKEKKCVCQSRCKCAVECTYHPERFCPCAEYTMRILLSQERGTPGNTAFGLRCASLARAVFDGLSVLRTDLTNTDIAAEVERAIQLFSNEVRVQRNAAANSE